MPKATTFVLRFSLTSLVFLFIVSMDCVLGVFASIVKHDKVLLILHLQKFFFGIPSNLFSAFLLGLLASCAIHVMDELKRGERISRRQLGIPMFVALVSTVITYCLVVFIWPVSNAELSKRRLGCYVSEKAVSVYHSGKGEPNLQNPKVLSIRGLLAVSRQRENDGAVEPLKPIMNNQFDNQMACGPIRLTPTLARIEIYYRLGLPLLLMVYAILGLEMGVILSPLKRFSKALAYVLGYFLGFGLFCFVFGHFRQLGHIGKVSPFSSFIFPFLMFFAAASVLGIVALVVLRKGYGSPGRLRQGNQ